MKIAILSDIHGNLAALEAVLSDAAKQSVEQIICAGDTINPLQDSKAVWQTLKALKIPTLRGNHEDYIVNYWNGSDPKWQAPNFKPTQLVAEQLGDEIIQNFSQLPLTHRILPKPGKELLVCHASPLSNRISFYNNLSSEMRTALENSGANTIVSGHCHQQSHQIWQGRSLISFGSTGMSLTGKPTAQYIILEFKKNEWCFAHQEISYDNQHTVNSYKESGWLAAGGAIAWLYCDQLLTGEDRIAPCFKYIESKNWPFPSTMPEWYDRARSYFQAINRWQVIKQYI